MLGGGAIEWKFQCQTTISLSSTEAEYKALSMCATEVVYLKQVLKGFGIEQKPTPVFEDTVGAIKLAENWASTKRTKYIGVHHHYIRELVENKIIKIEYISPEDQPADILTKPVTGQVFGKHKRFILNLN